VQPWGAPWAARRRIGASTLREHGRLRETHPVAGTSETHPVAGTSLVPVSDPSRLRIADSDRERVAEDLREHTVAGRLTTAELEERLTHVYEAATQADLDAVRDDLPAAPGSVQRALVQRRAHLRRRLAQEAGGAISVSLVCVAIWAASGASGAFWPIWVIVFTLLPILRSGWRLLGPAPDVESVEAHLEARRRHRLAREERHHRRRGLPR
jgi:DUF1707 SHOCT-like domain